jgi:hypothetical protein
VVGDGELGVWLAAACWRLVAARLSPAAVIAPGHLSREKSPWPDAEAGGPRGSSRPRTRVGARGCGWRSAARRQTGATGCGQHAGATGPVKLQERGAGTGQIGHELHRYGRRANTGDGSVMMVFKLLL